MEKETKNIITREGCKKDLHRTEKADLFFNLVLLAVMLLIFVPLIIASIYLLKYLFILGLVFGLSCTVGPIIFIYKTVRSIMKLHLIKNNEFSIVMDTVCRLSRGELVREVRHPVNAIYFTEHGRYLPSNAVFDLTSIDDKFYLVVLHTKKNELCFAFHTMMYDCKDF